MSLKTKLILRYVTGLVLIAFALTLSFGFLIKQISANEKDAYIINISGMQRMLSQRIALMAREIYHAPNDQEARIYVDKMQVAVKRMIQNHRELVSGKLSDGNSYTLSPALSDLYFRDNGIDQRVTLYTQTARDFLTLYKSQGLESVQDSDLVYDIARIARNGLLNDLNTAVSQYEQESEDSLIYFQKLEALFLAFGLFILVLEAFLIFQPMVNRIARDVKELEETNEELREFSYRISHDLRAPVISSIALVDFMVDSVQQDKKEETLDALSHMKRSLIKLEKLTQDLIQLIKIKKEGLEREELLLQDILDEAIDNIDNLDGYKTIKIHQNVEFEDPFFAEKIYVQQIVENLISNAIKYQDSQKDNSFVKIHCGIQNNHIFISVEDNGLGIPEQFEGKIFKMFERFHPGAAFGSGLGLYVVKKNADALGGDVAYEKTQDGGCRFFVSFPYHSRPSKTQDNNIFKKAA